MQLEVIGALLTHRSPSSTLIYTHPTAEDLRGVLAERGVLEKVADLVWMSAEPLRVIRGWRRAAGLGGAVGQRDVWCQSELPHGDLASTYRGEEFIRFRADRPAVAEGGRQALGADAAAGGHGAADDERLSGRRQRISASGWPSTRRR